jgi:hypothetical protein
MVVPTCGQFVCTASLAIHPDRHQVGGCSTAAICAGFSVRGGAWQCHGVQGTTGKGVESCPGAILKLGHPASLCRMPCKLSSAPAHVNMVPCFDQVLQEHTVHHVLASGKPQACWQVLQGPALRTGCPLFCLVCVVVKVASSNKLSITLQMQRWCHCRVFLTTSRADGRKGCGLWVRVCGEGG